MSFRELVKEIPTSMYGTLSDKFMNVLLEAKEGGNVPSKLAKDVLYHSMRGQLASEACLINLLDAVAIADPQRAAEILEEAGLEEVKRALKPAE